MKSYITLNGRVFHQLTLPHDNSFDYLRVKIQNKLTVPSEIACYDGGEGNINRLTLSCLINNAVNSKNISSGHSASVRSSTDVFIQLMWRRGGWLLLPSTASCTVNGMISILVKTAINSNPCLLWSCPTHINNTAKTQINSNTHEDT